MHRKLESGLPTRRLRISKIKTSQKRKSSIQLLCPKSHLGASKNQQISGGRPLAELWGKLLFRFFKIMATSVLITYYLNIKNVKRHDTGPQ